MILIDYIHSTVLPKDNYLKKKVIDICEDTYIIYGMFGCYRAINLLPNILRVINNFDRPIKENLYFIMLTINNNNIVINQQVIADINDLNKYLCLI